MLFLFATIATALPLSPTGPVIASNFQDPSILKVDDTYYAYSGPNGNPDIHVLTATSTDFSTWTIQGEALPTVGAWAADPPTLWAPDVIQIDDQFILYYSARINSKHCIGVATSSNPLGPFQPQDTPLFCDLSIGGAIDPDAFKDPVSGNQYVVYKVDGNSLGHGGACMNTVPPIVPTPLILQQMDGTSPVGEGIEILTNDESDGPLIEAPALAYNDGVYTLFYSSSCFTQSDYAIKYATSTSITGPYTRKGTFLATGGTAANVYIPGGIDIEPSTSRAVFHGDINKGWFENDGSKRVRAMYAADVTIGDNAAVGELY